MSHADELWLRVATPLAERDYSANAICTLSGGVEQWAAALAQHSQTSRVVLAVAPAPMLQSALAVAFGGSGAGRPNPKIRRAQSERGRGRGAGTETPASATLATLWPEMLPGSVLLDKNGAFVAGSGREQAKAAGEPGQAAASGQFAAMEEAVSVVYENVVCYPVTSSQSVDVGAAIAAVCVAAASGSGPIGLL